MKNTTVTDLNVERVDRTQLTEALADDALEIREELLPVAIDLLDSLDVIVAAAQWAADFPTDEQVRAGVVALRGEGRARHVDSADWEEVRAVLEAVRDTMIGDNQ